MAGIAGQNVDGLIVFDPANANISAYYRSLGIRASQHIKHTVGGFVTVKIPTANVLTLNSVPIQIVPAAGAGMLIVPTRMIATMVYNTTTYSTNSSGASLIYGLNGAGTSTGFTLSQAFLQASSGTNTQVVNQASSATYLPASTDLNVPLTLIAASSDPTTGNSDLYVRVYFRIEAIPFTNPAMIGA